METAMKKIRVTLTQEQVHECMVALYKAGNPLGDEFRRVLDRLEKSDAEPADRTDTKAPEPSVAEKVLRAARARREVDDMFERLFC
nr:MAG TPA: hypothetical protein [Caudoviricetes sp.]